MAQHVSIRLLNEYVGREVTLRGWIYTARSGGKVLFLVVRDGTGEVQCIVEKNEQSADFFDAARHITQESSVRVTGTVRADERTEGAVEVAVSGFEVIQKAADYPITPKAHGIDFLLKHRHLWLRSKRQHAILSIRSTLVNAVRQFFDERDFVLFDTPIFSPAAGEGASTLFEVDYFGKPVYLAQTGQLYLEAACLSHGKVYCFGPTFRAEKSKTRRHLTEFWMVEPEVAFADLDDVMVLAEDMICFILERVLDKYREDLKSLGRDLTPLERVAKPFIRRSYSECVDTLRGPDAVKLLDEDFEVKSARIKALEIAVAEKEQQRSQAKKAWQQDKLAKEILEAREELADLTEQVGNIPTHKQLAADFEWGKDLGGSDETIISRLHDGPTFVHRYPKQAKAFYMKQDPEDLRVVKNFDLLAPEGFGEIIGGSQREDDLDALLARMDEEGMDREPYEWYIDLRRYGSVPHGGFGLGIERTLGWICGLKHVRETIAFPRMMGKLYP